MKKFSFYIFSALIIISLSECYHKHYCISQDNTTKEHFVIKEQKTDSAFYKTILPYKTKIDKDLNIKIAEAPYPLEKNKQCNNLAQLVFESMKWYADSVLKNSAYYVLINYGGLRANLPQGEILKRNIFELMPFDNAIIILELNDEQFQTLLSKAQENSKLLLKSTSSSSTKILVTSDYLYQGGDDCTFLKNAHKIHYSNFLIRYAIIRYCKEKKVLNINCFH